ncbi:putative toxin-antitoxin system toxin component, PIN family [Thermodesulfovibrio aggregans]|jgi:predicted nucleic acid-binding protein|uniref:Putative toxin-antitoxin system toxin component, PIN family n=1 Tax=Thermodesulfovibrio aggregans TaxID=86166 RepID=A0A0U9HN52_9BACT|nr:putative toxin-antitoxin system toxin component, PIN family [Thermodesulfovibrio aggregans]GAQ94510.1 putative toxin-antitoxin system toxin component, PIN family [Thermodesulfovibrio aggregans]
MFKDSQEGEVNSSTDIINEAVTDVIQDSLTISGICKDKDDDNIIACAVASNADYIVTGDTELLSVKKYKRIRILSPRDFELLFD